MTKHHDRLDALLSVKLHCAQLARELEGVGLPKSADKLTWISAYVQTEIVQEEARLLATATPSA